MPVHAPLDVQVTLRCADGLDDFDTRVFTLRPGASPGAHPSASIPLGRSSRNPLKPELMIGSNNAYIDAPTISREHAILKATSPSAPIVTITDNGSMHGTTINGARLDANKPRRLHNGDELTFGADIMRDQQHFTPRKFVFESSIVTDSYSFAVPDYAISSEDEEDIEVDEVKSTPLAHGAVLDQIEQELADTHHDIARHSSQDMDEFGNENLFVGEDEFLLQVDSDNLDTTLSGLLEDCEEHGSLAPSPVAVSRPTLHGLAPRPVLSSFVQDAYSDNDGSWGGPPVSTSFTNESYSDDDVSIDYPSDDGALASTHSYGSDSENAMESGDDGSFDSGDSDRIDGYEPEQQNTETIRATDLADVGLDSAEEPASSPMQSRTWDTSPLPLPLNVYHAVPAPITEASSETINGSLDGSYRMPDAPLSTLAVSSLTPVSEASTAMFWSTVSACSKQPAHQTSPSEVTSPCHPPARRTKVSIPEIIEETHQQPEQTEQPKLAAEEQTQQPELAAEVNGMTRGTKRKAEMFEEGLAEPETQLALDASSGDAHGVMTSNQGASPEIIAQRPKKPMRRRLGGMVKTAAAWMVPGVVGAAGAVAFLTSVPNDFFVP